MQEAGRALPRAAAGVGHFSPHSLPWEDPAEACPGPWARLPTDTLLTDNISWGARGSFPSYS